MEQSNIKPEKITKPIQLLGAWLAGLFSVDSCFLFAAANMESGSFESQALVVAAIVNVPLFLLAVFLLQTKFRPELQEDSYYSSYLSQKNNEPVIITKSEKQFSELSLQIATLKEELKAKPNDGDVTLISSLTIGVNSIIENYQRTKEMLSEAGALGISTFDGNGEHPGSLSVAISEYLPKNSVKEVVKFAKEAGYTHYGYFDHVAEETEETVLFGAYGANHIEIT